MCIIDTINTAQQRELKFSMDSNAFLQMSNLFVAGNAVMRSIDPHYNLIFKMGSNLEGFFASPQDADDKLHGQNFEMYEASDSNVRSEQKTVLSNLDYKTIEVLYTNEDFVSAIEALTSEYPLIKSVILTHDEDLYGGETYTVAEIPANEIHLAATEN